MDGRDGQSDASDDRVDAGERQDLRSEAARVAGNRYAHARRPLERNPHGSDLDE
jgi:hypothetical protein